MLPSGIRDCVVHCFSILKFFFGHLLSILRRFTVFDLALWCLQNFLIMWIGMIWRLSFGAMNASSPTISHRDRKNIHGKA